MNGPAFHLIPHTHWDREWYLPRAAFQARLVPVLDAVLEQLEADPAARFLLDGQTILLEDYLALRPEQEPRLAEQVRRGALEIGPWYVLSDLLIPSATSLRRNLAEGARDAERFGKRLDVLYSPDAFGHPAELPDLAAEFGIRRAVVRRGLGRPEGKDRDLYRWEGPGGSSLLVYHLPAGGYDMAIALAEAGADLERIWAPIRRELLGRAVGNQLAVFLGADHHAMVRDVSALCARLQALEPEHRVRVSGLTEFFAAVERSPLSLPVLRGELRRGDGHTWVLQGVHATRSRLKRLHGKAELDLSRLAEPLADPADSGVMRLAWRTLLASQFHDTLAGTTCDAVQQEQEVRLGAVASLAREVAYPALRALARPAAPTDPPRLLLWNPATRARSGVTTAELTFFRKDVLVGQPTGRRPGTGAGYRPFVLESATGAIIPVQLLGLRREEERIDSLRRYPDQDEVDRVWVAFRAPVVPGQDATVLLPRERRLAAPPAGLEVAPGSLRNTLLSLAASSSGLLTVVDLRTGEQYPDCCALVDEPDHGDTYTCSPGSAPPSGKIRPLSQRIVAHGPLVVALETRWTLHAASRGEIGVRQVVALYADSPLIRLRLELENRALDHRLRAYFPVRVRGPALAGTALGAVARLPGATASRGTALERVAATAPAHRFVSAAEGARGLALFAPACFEYEWTRKGTLALTLLRSVGELSRDALPERPGHAAWPMPTPLAQESGSHRIDLAFVTGTAAELGHPAPLERLWEDAALPLQAVYSRSTLEANHR